MTSGQLTPQGTPASGLPSEQTGGMDDFGDFSQGPSFRIQGGNDGDFSDFQEAAQPTPQFGGMLLLQSISQAPHISMVYSLSNYTELKMEEQAVNYKP